jgi:hypothetical protein
MPARIARECHSRAAGSLQAFWMMCSASSPSKRSPLRSPASSRRGGRSMALSPTMDIRSARTGKAREAMIHPFVPYSPGQFALSRPRLRARINLPAQEDGATLIEATGSAGSSPRRPTRHPARVSAPIEMVASSRSFGALATSPNQRVRSRPILDRDDREGTRRCQVNSKAGSQSSPEAAPASVSGPPNGSSWLVRECLSRVDAGPSWMVAWPNTERKRWGSACPAALPHLRRGERKCHNRSTSTS